jgi:hypothetical protein
MIATEKKEHKKINSKLHMLRFLFNAAIFFCINFHPQYHISQFHSSKINFNSSHVRSILVGLFLSNLPSLPVSMTLFFVKNTKINFKRYEVAVRERENNNNVE